MAMLFVVLALGAGFFALPGGGRGDTDRRIAMLAAFCAFAAALFLLRLGVFGVLMILVGAGIFGIGWLRDRLTDEGFQDLSEDKHTGHGTGAHHATLSDEEALQILGLEGEPTTDEIRAAHRRLIAGTHPDTGGSDYIAAKINQARDKLLGP